jgi:NAD(P) transhydrogenase
MVAAADAYDLVVIGSGPAGEKGAALAAYFGRRVALVERDDRPGGAPVNRGGIPAKSLREAALYLTGHQRREVYGVGLGLSPEIVLERLRTRAAEVSRTMAEVVRLNLARHGIELIHGEASLAGERAVRVIDDDGRERRLRASVVLVATGSRPFHPPGIPFDDPAVHDSDTILEIDAVPRSLVVIGGGPVGLEYASIFATLGVSVTVIDAADRLFPLLDVEISTLLQKTFLGMGVQVLLGSPGATVGRHDGRLQVGLADGRVLEPDAVLFAAGRAGNTEGLGCAEAGLELDPRGRIVVDDRLRTTNPSIYAAGDVIGPPALASVSAEQGRLAACHAFGVPYHLSLDPLPPVGVYSLPEVGMVGLTEQAAREAGEDIIIGRAWFNENARSQIAGTTDGMIKLVARREDRRLIGVHILGEDAAELIHIGQAVIQGEGTIDRLVHTTFNVPTRAELFKYAAYDALGADP